MKLQLQLPRIVLGRWWSLSAIVFLGLSLRIYRIDHQSLWFDEAFTLTVSQLPLGEMTRKIIQDFVHPPLHYYMLHFWFELFQFGAFQGRLLSAIFGTLAILMIYLLACRLFEHRTALLSAGLLAVSQLGVMYSQEARPYAQFLFLLLSSIYLFITALQKNRALRWWGFVFSAILMIYTHYYGLFVLASLLLYAILYRRRYPLPRLWLIGGTVLGLLLLSPWLTSGVVEHALDSPKTLPSTLPPWFAVNRWTVFESINQFNNGRLVGLLTPSPLWTFLAGVLLFTGPALFSLKVLTTTSGLDSPERVHQENVILLGTLWLVPLLLIFALGAVNVQYDVRYVAFCVAPYYILVSRGISELHSPIVRRAFVVLVLAYSTFALRANYFIPYKENYRDALAYLAREYKEGDCCIFVPFGNVPLQWSIYHPELSPLRVTSVDAVTSGQVDCGRVWLVAYSRVPWAKARGEEAKLELRGKHATIEERAYFWVDVGLYIASDERVKAMSETVRPAGLRVGIPGEGKT